MNKKLVLILTFVLVIAISAVTVFAITFLRQKKPLLKLHRKLKKPQKMPKAKVFPEPLATPKEIIPIFAAQCIKIFTKQNIRTLLKP